MTTDTEQTLVDAAWPYWECEGEIAKRYYAGATDEDHAFYLKAQLWKELHPVDGFFNGLHKELKELVKHKEVAFRAAPANDMTTSETHGSNALLKHQGTLT